MFVLGLGLLGSIFLSAGCLVAAFKSLASLTREAFNAEAKLLAVMGFIIGILASAFFGWSTIMLVNRLSELNPL